MEEMQCGNQERHEAHKWWTWTSVEAWCRGNWRPALMDDLAVLKLYIDDTSTLAKAAGRSADEVDPYEALARVLGALELSSLEEDWLEQQ